MRIVTPVRGLLLRRRGVLGSGGLRGGGGLLAARAESEGLSGFGLRMLRSIRIACAEVGLTVAGAVRRPRIARCLCRIIGRLRCAGRGSGVLPSGPVLGRRRIGGRLALGVMFLRRCIGAGPLTVVRLPELLLVRLSVLLCAGLVGGGELALLSELIGSGLAGSSRSGLLAGCADVTGSGLTRPTWLTGSGLTRPTWLTGSGLARPSRCRSVGSESGSAAGHIGHGGRVRRMLGHRAGLRVAVDVFATGEFAGEERDHGEYAGEEGKQRGEERQ